MTANANVEMQVDGVTDYIDWAVGEKFGIMDINIPSYVATENVSNLPDHLLSY